jgi:DNA-3-methyladenine glycosylase
MAATQSTSTKLSRHTWGAARPARAFFQTDAATLARRLIGQQLVRRDPHTGQRLAGLIVETEAYLGVCDQAAHTYNGRRTARNEAMWGQAGHAYVYFTYGMHHCMNIVAQGPEVPEAVLIRAIEPTQGLAAMRPRRPAAKRDTGLCSGPAKLCQALAIDRALDGQDLLAGERLWVERLRQRAVPRAKLTVGPRIGVHYAGPWAEAPLRFALAASAHTSRP